MAYNCAGIRIGSIFSFFLAPNSPLVATVKALLMISVDINREAGADSGLIFFRRVCTII